MPKIERTERAVTTRATYQPYDTRPVGQEGAGLKNLGNAISSLGTALGNQDDEQSAFEARMAISDYTFRKTKELDERVSSYNPAQHGAPEEFDRNYLAEREQADEQFRATIKGGPKIQRWAALQLQENRQRAALAAQNARQGFVMNGNIERIESLSAQIGSTITGDPSSVTGGLKALDGAIDAVPNLTQRQRQILRKHAADSAWKYWLQRATPEQMRKAVQDYEAGHDAWRQRFNEEKRSDAKIENHGEHSTVSSKSGARFRVASSYAPRFAGLIADLEAEGVEIKSEQSGGYADRNIAGTSTKSRHAYGEAIDINWSENARGSRGAMAKKLGPEKLNEIAKRHGMTWGGNWRNPDDMHFEIDREAKVAEASPVAKREGQLRYLSGTPGDETGNGITVPRERINLPDRATMGDHAINEFTGLVPAIKKRIAEADAEAEANAWFERVANGQEKFNSNDAAGRKFIDDKFAAAGVGDRIFKGDAQALLGATTLADRMGYVPKPVYGALKGMIEDKDPMLAQRGYDAALNLYDRNPNIFNGNDGEASLLKDAEHYRRLTRTMEPQEAIKYMRELKAPGSKLVREANKDRIDKFMKGYQGEAAADQVAKDLDTGWFFQSAPRTDDDFRQQGAIIADYTDTLRREYEATGNETEAKAAAASFVKRRYGVSEVMGEKVVTAYPIERHYPKGPDGTHAYIKKEVDEIVGTYSPSAKRTWLVPLDKRHWDGGKPAYGIWVLREDGRREMIPQRFVPGAPGVKEEFERERAKKMAPPAPLDLTTPEGRKSAVDNIRVPDLKGAVEQPIKDIREGIRNPKPNYGADAPLSIEAP